MTTIIPYSSLNGPTKQPRNHNTHENFISHEEETKKEEKNMLKNGLFRCIRTGKEKETNKLQSTKPNCFIAFEWARYQYFIDGIIFS